MGSWGALPWALEMHALGPWGGPAPGLWRGPSLGPCGGPYKYTKQIYVFNISLTSKHIHRLKMHPFHIRRLNLKLPKLQKQKYATYNMFLSTLFAFHFTSLPKRCLPEARRAPNRGAHGPWRGKCTTAQGLGTAACEAPMITLRLVYESKLGPKP